VDSFSFGVVLWELITKEQTHRGNWRPVRVPEECPAEVESLLKVRSDSVSRPGSVPAHCSPGCKAGLTPGLGGFRTQTLDQIGGPGYCIFPP
jgi:hypothetical protein